MFCTIWERYFFKEIVKVVILFIVSIYFLYVLIDFSSNSSSLAEKGLGFKGLSTYYFFVFVKRLEILLPFAILVGSIRTMTKLNVHNELIALLANGIKMRTLTRPFIVVGIAGSLLVYLSTEKLLPKTLTGERVLEDTVQQDNIPDKNKKTVVNSYQFNDNSTLLYQKYDSARDYFFDAYWIRSIDEIYRIKYLYPDAEFMIGRFVDKLVRDEEGILQLVESFESMVLPDVSFDQKSLQTALEIPHELPISKLIEQYPVGETNLNEKEAQVVTWLYSKLTMPLLCLLVAFAPLPWCVRFSRTLSIFMIYILGVFGLITFYLFMDAALILALGQVIPASIAILTPFALGFGFFGYRYLRME